MTEAEWLACTDPDALLDFLHGRLSDRKLRLFACACCGPVWHLVTEQSCRLAVNTALSFADGETNAEILKGADTEAHFSRPLFMDANWAAAWTTNPTALRAAREAAMCAAQTLARIDAEAAKSNAWAAVRSGAAEEDRATAWAQFEATEAEALTRERARQADLLRELVANPFRPLTLPAGIPPAAVALATSLYAGDDCAFALHDALEEAGHVELAGHFLSPEHPRGCWALDLLLGKS